MRYANAALVPLGAGNPRRVILHWTAGTNTVSSIDREHYHYIVESDGTIVAGRYTIADNDSTSDGRYAAHTLNCNTRSVGLACAGMAGGRETQYPLTARQIIVFCELAAKICQHYAIDVTPRTVLMHSEVQATLGIQQRGKIDLDWLTSYPDLRTRQQVGDYLRAQIVSLQHENPPAVSLLYQSVSTPAILQDGTTLLPLRETCALRLWTLTLLPDFNARIVMNGEAYLLQYTIINGTGYISARKLADALDLKLTWNSKTRQAVME